MEQLREPVVRIRTTSDEDRARCRQILEGAGLSPDLQLTWLVVREADPDAVNALLVAGGAVGRVVVRERVGALIGWFIDRQGALAGRARNVRALVDRALSDGGLSQRYRSKRDDAALEAAATALYAKLMAEGAPFYPWARFVEAFCEAR